MVGFFLGGWSFSVTPDSFCAMGILWCPCQFLRFPNVPWDIWTRGMKERQFQREKVKGRKGAGDGGTKTWNEISLYWRTAAVQDFGLDLFPHPPGDAGN